MVSTPGAATACSSRGALEAAILELRVADAGLGLISIDERVRLAQGGWQIMTAPRRGTALRVGVPLHAGAGTLLEEEHAPRQSTGG